MKPEAKRARRRPPLVPDRKRAGKEAGTFDALAKDRAGRFHGPEDLASNPRHLEDFGR